MEIKFDEIAARRFFKEVGEERYLKTNRNLAFLFFGIAQLTGLLSAGADGLPFFTIASGAMLCALGIGFFWVVKLAATGMRIYWQTLLFLPWLLFLGVEVFCGNAPWESLTALCQNLFVFFGFVLAVQCPRSDDSQFYFLVQTMTLAALALMGGVVYNLYTGGDSGVETAFLGFFISGRQAALVSLFVFFAAIVPVVYPRSNIALKLAGIYCAFFAGAVVFIAGGIAGKIALLAGAAFVIWYFVEKRAQKIFSYFLLFLVLSATLVISQFETCVFRNVSEIKTNAPAENFSESVPADFTFPRAAWKTFAESPLAGSGSGTFGEAFPNHVPATVKAGFVPETCGSLPLHILAENGVLGALLLLVPAVVLWIFGASEISGTKFYDDSSDARAFEMRRRPIASERVLMTCSAAGLLAFGIAVVFDYEIFSPGVMLPFAVFAGTLFRIALSRKKASGFEISDVPSVWIRALFGIGVPVLLFAALFPCTSSFEKTGRADSLLREYCNAVGERRTLEAAPEDLKKSIELYFSALAHARSNTRAWQGLFRAYAVLCAFEPQNLDHFAAIMDRCADEQLSRRPSSSRAHWQKGLALALTGKSEEAGKHLSAARELAPEDVSLLMNLGEAWRKISFVSTPAAEIYRELHARFPNDETIGMIYAGLQLVAPVKKPDGDEGKVREPEIEI